MLNEDTLKELRALIRKYKEEMMEGSTTAGAGGYDTPAAFAKPGQESRAVGADKTYIHRPKKEKRNFVKIHEASYQQFKSDNTRTDIQKVNEAILNIVRLMREVDQTLNHSLKLKQESAIDNSAYWRKTNEAILKLSKRLKESTAKVKKLANLKEIAEDSFKRKIHALMTKAGIQFAPDDTGIRQIGSDEFEIDIYVDGEPYGFDYRDGQLYLQDIDSEKLLGNLSRETELIPRLRSIFNTDI